MLSFMNSKLTKMTGKGKENHILWSIGLVVKVLDSQSKGPVFKTTGWLQGWLRLLSSLGR